MKRLISILLLLLGVIVRAQPQPPPPDAILIVGISPTAFTDGEESEVTVNVAYNLASSDGGVIDLSSNELKAQSFSPFAHLRVKKGNSMATISGKMTPRYWTASAPAKLHVSLRSSTADPVIHRRPLASDETAITVPRPAHPPETHPNNPNPSNLYEDAINIKSVTPEFLIEGRETEITVTVGYELLSREAGEINLGINAGRGSGYKIVASTVVKIGPGEATIRAVIVPVKTGPLPFAKIFVNLSEYPHRPTWSPLAGDSHVVDVR